MAFTTSHLMSTVMGNVRCVSVRVTADAAEANLTFNLQNVTGLGVAYQSMTSGAGKWAINENSSGAASLGNVGVSGVASGDEFLLTVYGV